MSVTKKIDNSKILDTYFSVFQYSKPFGDHATLNVYIQIYIIIRGIQQEPPCRRQSRMSVTKKIDNPKILDTYFSVLRYSKPFGAHATSNVYIQIYIIIRANLRPPCRRYRGGSSTKKIDNAKIFDSWFFVFRYFQPFDSHATSNFSKYRYIYIITVILPQTLIYISTYIY